jgi:hypothetical protein
MMKPLLVAVLLTGLCTPVASAVGAPPPICLEPPVADKNELCVNILSYGGKEFAGYGRFLAAPVQAPSFMRVYVEQRAEMWPEPILLVEKTVTGPGELSTITDGAPPRADARTVRACATGWTAISARRYEVCTPWQTV